MSRRFRSDEKLARNAVSEAKGNRLVPTNGPSDVPNPVAKVVVMYRAILDSLGLTLSSQTPARFVPESGPVPVPNPRQHKSRIVQRRAVVQNVRRQGNGKANRAS